MSETTTDLPEDPGHLSPERMNHYAFRALDADALLAADDHLAACPECRSRMVDEAGLGATVRSLGREVGAARHPDPDHLSYETVEALAEERLRGAAREIADLHVEGCPTCAGEVADLRAFVAAHRAARRAAAAAVAAAHMGLSTTDAGTAAGHARAPRPASGAGAILSGADAAATEAAATAVPGAAGDRDAPLTLPSAGRARRGVPIAAAVAAMLAIAAGGGWLATRQLRRERDDLARKVQELGEQNTALAARADEATRSRADIERQAAATALQNARPTAVTLQDRRGREGTATVGLDDDGQLVGLDTLSLADARAVAAALRRGSIEIPAEVLALVRDDGGAAPGPALIAPVGVAVRGARPTFAWQAQQGASGYTLEILDEGGTVAMRGGPTRAAKWTPPRPLRRGGTYAWSVAAALPGDPGDAAAPAGASPATAPAAAGDAAGGAEPVAEPARALTVVSARGRFRVLDADAAAALDRALRAASGSRLAAGVFYARAGLLDESIVELRALAEANRDSDLVRSLLASVETAHTAR
jgi:hypothetical protein